MQLRFKALAAAALVALSGAAAASIDTPASGNGELVLIAYDFAQNITYVQDLGTPIQSFNGAASGPLVNLTGWSSFESALGNNLSGVRWSVMSGDGVAPINQYMTLVDQIGNGSGTSNIAQSRISTINGNLTSLENAHNLLASHTTEANGWSVMVSDSAVGGQGSLLFGPGANFNGFSGRQAAGTLDQDMYFYSFTNGTSLGSTRTAYGNALGQGIWSLDEVAGTLQYTAPVPEPGTYALMFAGLLTLGAVARRRSK